MSPSGAGEYGGRADRPEGGRANGRSSRSRPSLTVRLCRRCWCRSWSSTRSVIRPRVPRPPSPCPRPARPPGRGGHSDASRISFQLLPKRLDWEGNEHNRSYEELVSTARPRPPRARSPAHPRPWTGLCSRAGPAGKLSEGGGIHGDPGRPAQSPPPQGSRWGRGEIWLTTVPGAARAPAGASLARGLAGSPGAPPATQRGPLVALRSDL